LRSARFKGQNPTVEKIITLVRKGGFDMPAFPPTLISDEEVQQIAEFVVSLPEDKP
jgi:mono/diheme cytochrome c family protein